MHHPNHPHAQRSKLAFFKKNVTPVNEQTFAQWKTDKAEARKRENAERVGRVWVGRRAEASTND